MPMDNHPTGYNHSCLLALDDFHVFLPWMTFMDELELVQFSIHHHILYNIIVYSFVVYQLS